MSDKLSDIKQTWRERFGDSRQWMTEVFTRIYTDRDAIALEIDDRIVSSLLLRPMVMNFRGQNVPVGYIYGAATRRSEQGRGYMTRLVVDALNCARSRGQCVVMLHPARRRLYGFYAKLGFTTAIFIDEKRYTAVHKFAHDESRYLYEDSIFDYNELADAYTRLASGRGACVLHDADDFRTILIDNDLDRGLVSVVRYADSGSIAAVAFAKPNRYNGTISVTELVAHDDDAANAALSQIASSCPGMMTVVEAYPERSKVKFSARGMARIVDAEGFLSIIAKLRPRLRMTIKIDDRVITENNGVFRIENGTVARMDGRHYAKGVDLDVNIEVLTAILFSSEKIGDLFDLPTARLFASLMLS